MPTHPSKGHSDKEVVRGGDTGRTKEEVLRPVGTPGGAQRKSPGIEGAEGGAQGPGTRVPNKFLGRVRRDLKGIMLHGPQEEDSVAMRWHHRKVTGMGQGGPELVTKPLKAADIPLVPDEGLRGPRVGGVDESHALQHHQSVHDAAGQGRGANISTNSAQLADKRVTGKGLGKEEEALSQVPVPRPEGGAHADTSGMV
jgi:hypothetical protein